MNEGILQGLATAVPLLMGLLGMLINSWVACYRDDKHFFRTRFLDKDGNPDSEDYGYFKDSSGKLIPIVVLEYSFGMARRKRYVEGFEVTADGEYGLPFKMSLASFRTKEIRRPKFLLNEVQKALLTANSMSFVSQKALGTSVRDLARSVDSLSARVTNAGKAVAGKKCNCSKDKKS